MSQLGVTFYFTSINSFILEAGTSSWGQVVSPFGAGDAALVVGKIRDQEV